MPFANVRGNNNYIFNNTPVSPVHTVHEYLDDFYQNVQFNHFNLDPF